MMNLKKSGLSKYYFSLFFLVLIVACEKEKIEDNFVAKVAESLLTESDLMEALDSKYNSKKYRDEYIRQWIETELLYQEAIDHDVLEQPEYNEIIKQSKKQLAAAFILQEHFEDQSLEYDNRELQNYFSKYVNDFKTTDDSYILNIARFKDESRAILFRYTVLENGWSRASNIFKNDYSVINLVNNQFLSRYQVSPIMLSRTVKNLLPNEVSIVLQTEPEVFTVVQLVTFLEKNSFPKYEYVEDLVKERYLVTKKAQEYRKFIDELFVKYNVKFNKEVE